MPLERSFYVADVVRCTACRELFFAIPFFLPSAPPRSAEGGRGDDGGQIEGALTAEGGGGMGKEKVLTISDLHRSKG